MKKFSIITILFLLIIFSICILYTRNTVKVLKVYAPHIVALDINKNGKIEANEKFEIANIQSFVSKPNGVEKVVAERLGIDEDTALSIGYYAEKYAQSILEDKNVQYKIVGNGAALPLIDITVNGKNYSKIFRNSPFAFENSIPINKKEFIKQIELAKKMDLRIYNNKSNKYHKLSCKFGQFASDSVILPKNQLPKDAQPCKICESQTTKTHKMTTEEYEQKIINESTRKVFTYSDGNNIKLYLTDLTTVFKPEDKCSSDFCLDLLKKELNAEKSIDIALYGYTDIKDITDSLAGAIKRGVTVRLVYDVDANGSNFYPNTFKLAKYLHQSRADYGSEYQQYIMHNKFFIFDNKTVLTGSANISTSDVSGYNSNAILLINSPEVANIYTQEFEQMYNGKFHNQKQQIANNKNILVGNSILSIYFSPQDNIINNVLIPMINKSTKYVYIPAFVITHKNLTQALIDAKKRGVDVKMIIDATNAKNQYSTHEQLRKNGILIKTENYAGKMHSKSIIIDDKYVVVGSMNFSKSGEEKNDENVVVIENPDMAKYYKDFFKYQWKKIPNIWLLKNAGGESHDSIGSCNDGVDNDFDGKVDSEDAGCKSYKKK